MVQVAEWLLSVLKLEGECDFHNKTGLYCPGCGGTRALFALLRGNVLLSIYYYPIIPYVAGIFCLWAVRYIVSVLWPDGPIRKMPYKMGYVYAGIIIFYANWLLKNLGIYVFGIEMR